MKTEIEEQYDKIYQYCYFHVHSRVLAEDLTQETFLRFLRRTDGKVNDCSIAGEKQLAYLYVTARNLCTDYFRSCGRERERMTELFTEEKAEESADKMDMAECLALREAVASLQEEWQELVWLRFFEGLSVAATAQILGISRFAVYRRERGALKQLREVLEGKG